MLRWVGMAMSTLGLGCGLGRGLGESGEGEAERGGTREEFPRGGLEAPDVERAEVGGSGSCHGFPWSLLFSGEAATPAMKSVSTG